MSYIVWLAYSNSYSIRLGRPPTQHRVLSGHQGSSLLISLHVTFASLSVHRSAVKSVRLVRPPVGTPVRLSISQSVIQTGRLSGSHSPWHFCGLWTFFHILLYILPRSQLIGWPCFVTESNLSRLQVIWSLLYPHINLPPCGLFFLTSPGVRMVGLIVTALDSHLAINPG